MREDAALQEALLFALYAYSGSEWSGDIAFVVDVAVTGATTIVFSMGPAGARLRCSSGRPLRPHAHSVICDRQVRHCCGLSPRLARVHLDVLVPAPYVLWL